ncbi:hypothetical protein VKT23_014145 [Stygiomarasmius scandens]|uniref:Uncharacterized protein n=1 Tax=Marasmiellus scandens TaxID=2682957 RepID=A0ABR1J480_9AGAR
MPSIAALYPVLIILMATLEFSKDEVKNRALTLSESIRFADRHFTMSEQDDERSRSTTNEVTTSPGETLILGVNSEANLNNSQEMNLATKVPSHTSTMRVRGLEFAMKKVESSSCSNGSEHPGYPWDDKENTPGIK